MLLIVGLAILLAPIALLVLGIWLLFAQNHNSGWRGLLGLASIAAAVGLGLAVYPALFKSDSSTASAHGKTAYVPDESYETEGSALADLREQGFSTQVVALTPKTGYPVGLQARPVSAGCRVERQRPAAYKEAAPRSAVTLYVKCGTRPLPGYGVVPDVFDTARAAERHLYRLGFRHVMIHGNTGAYCYVDHLIPRAHSVVRLSHPVTLIMDDFC
jgi:hypothetical protein